MKISTIAISAAAALAIAGCTAKSGRTDNTHEFADSEQIELQTDGDRLLLTSPFDERIRAVTLK